MNYILIFLNSRIVLYTWHVFGNFLELYADFQNEKKNQSSFEFLHVAEIRDSMGRSSSGNKESVYI